MLFMLGVMVFCAGVLCEQFHQVKYGPHRAHWVSYIGLTLNVVGGIFFVAGAMNLGQ